MRNCLSNGLLWFSNLSRISNIIEGKKKRSELKRSQDLPLAIFRTVFDAKLHDVLATVRSYFKWDLHQPFDENKIDNYFFRQLKTNYDARNKYSRKVNNLLFIDKISGRN